MRKMDDNGQQTAFKKIGKGGKEREKKNRNRLPKNKKRSPHFWFMRTIVLPFIQNIFANASAFSGYDQREC